MILQPDMEQLDMEQDKVLQLDMEQDKVLQLDMEQDKAQLDMEDKVLQLDMEQEQDKVLQPDMQLDMEQDKVQQQLDMEQEQDKVLQPDMQLDMEQDIVPTSWENCACCLFFIASVWSSMSQNPAIADSNGHRHGSGHGAPERTKFIIHPGISETGLPLAPGQGVGQHGAEPAAGPGGLAFFVFHIGSVSRGTITPVCPNGGGLGQ